MPQSPDPRRLVPRFSRGERWVHWTLAALMLVLIATAAILYLAPLSQLVGRRHLVEQIHVYTGFALPVPVLLGWLRSAALRLDTRRLNRFTPDDFAWLRSRQRRSGAIPVGKFNAGQKLNASFTVGAIAVMLGTGLIMYFTHLWPLAWRTGATFVHDWLAFGIFLVVAGHLWYAAKDPDARLGMRHGLVPLGWARREHGAWAAEQVREDKLRAAEAPRLPK
ncbi:MAG TPA: cytochrome b/b6 domain-containing protein [Actinomycetes bacterium]